MAWSARYRNLKMTLNQGQLPSVILIEAEAAVLSAPGVVTEKDFRDVKRKIRKNLILTENGKNG
jgi:hypothetical protein